MTTTPSIPPLTAPHEFNERLKATLDQAKQAHKQVTRLLDELEQAVRQPHAAKNIFTWLKRQRWDEAISAELYRYHVGAITLYRFGVLPQNQYNNAEIVIAGLNALILACYGARGGYVTADAFLTHIKQEAPTHTLRWGVIRLDDVQIGAPQTVQVTVGMLQ